MEVYIVCISKIIVKSRTISICYVMCALCEVCVSLDLYMYNLSGITSKTENDI